MDTFNNLQIDTAAKQLKHAADLGMVYPVMSRNDARRCKTIATAVRSAVTSADKHLVNSLNMMMGKDGGKRVDRIASLANAIDRFSKLNAGVLDGGASLKQAWIDLAWIAYAKLEIHGTDNAHYEQTNIPADGVSGDADIFNNPQWKRQVTLPDSAYPGFEWQLLETAEQFKPERGMKRATVAPSKYTTSELVGPRLPTAAREAWQGIKQTVEPLQGAIGSGLPFEVVAVPMPTESRYESILADEYQVSDLIDRHNWRDYAIHKAQ